VLLNKNFGYFPGTTASRPGARPTDPPFLTVPTETIRRRPGRPNEHTYVVDTGLHIYVDLFNLSDVDVGYTVWFCEAGGEQQQLHVHELLPKTSWTLDSLILDPDETDNELHIYDSYRRELRTLIFKVNIPVVGDPPTTMTLPDSEVLALLREMALYDQAERLALDGIYTLDQLKHMTDDHRRKYSISIQLRDGGDKLSKALQKRKTDTLDSTTALASMSSLLESLKQQ
jgi:hypothetical protein